MTRSLVRVAAAAALGAVFGALLLLCVYAARPALSMEFAVTPPNQVTGIYASELDPASGLTFAWTGDVLTVRLPGLDRQAAWTLDMRARAARPNPADNPEISIFADGNQLLTTRSSSDFSDIRVPIPARSDRDGLTIAVRSSETMVPGPHDRRSLGVMLDRMSLSPDRRVIAPRRAFIASAVAGAVTAAAIALLGVSGVVSVASAVVLAAAIALIVSRGFGPYTDYPTLVVRACTLTWLGTLAGAGAVRFYRRQPFSGPATFVVVLSACAAILKLSVLLHPDMPIGDAMFHAHRFHDVLSGKLYFTSIAPGNYSFPYAPGLYVLTMPLADLVRRGAADMTLLRTIVVVADGAAAVLLYQAVVRGSRIDRMRLAGALAVLLYHAIPLDWRIATVGNLTNAFAQALAVAAFALMAAPVANANYRYIALLSVVFTSAFLSHTSTFAISAVAATFAAALLYWRGESSLKPAARAVLISVLVSTIAAVAIYYGHFMETYKTEWARISVETASAAPDAGGRGIMTRLASVPRYLSIYIGPPVLILAVWGAIAARRLPAGSLMPVVSGWLLACLLFLVLGVVTPVDMRHYLAAIPALAVLAGIGAADGWMHVRGFRFAAAALLAWSLWVGVDTWWNTL